MAPQKDLRKLKTDGVFLFDQFKKHRLYLGPTVFSAALVGIGAIVFSLDGAISTISSLPLVVIFTGIFLVLVTADWAYRIHPLVYMKAESLFKFKSIEGENLLADTIDKVHSEKNFILATILPIGFFEVYFFLMKFHKLPVSSVYYNDIYSHLPVQVYFAIILGMVGYLYGVGAFAAFQHVFFVHSLSKHDLHQPNLHRTRIQNETRRLKELHEMTSMTLKASIAWFGGVALVGLLLIALGNFDAAFTLAVLVSAVLVGLIFFILPQFFLHGTIARAKQEARTEVLQKCERKWGEIKPEEMSAEELSEIYVLLDQVEKLEEWPAHYGLMIEEIAISVVPLIIGYAGQSFFHP
jgi:uncharacterized membrane protein